MDLFNKSEFFYPIEKLIEVDSDVYILIYSYQESLPCHTFTAEEIVPFLTECWERRVVFPDIKPPFFNPFSVPGAYLPILKNLLKVWGGIVNFLENMLFFTQGDTRAIIVNAAENNFYGHILAQLRGKANFKVYNTMNGNKFATPNNSDAEFDAWFVWDEMLKDLLE